MIRTLKEIHNGRVTVTMTVDTSPSQRLYTSEEVAWAQQTEAELVGQPLRRQIEELEIQHRVDGDGLRRKVRELGREATMAAVDVDSLRRQLAEERARCLVLAGQLGDVSASIFDPKVTAALDDQLRDFLGRWYVVATAIRQVRHIVAPVTD